MTRRPPVSPAAGGRALTLALALSVLTVQQARAGLFDDDEARRQIRESSQKTNDRLDTVAKGQIELANQIQSLREENARLRGQVETLTYELESARKRQQDFYVDLDGRLRKLEPRVAGSADARPAATAEEGKGAAPESSKKPVNIPVSDPVAENREYEAALNLFRANKFKESAAAFDAFAKAHPDSGLTPSAHYWQGNAYYSLHDCRRSIDAHRQLVGKWPTHTKAPDGLLNIGVCQQQLGDSKAARGTYEAVLAKYPESSAASTARQRLKK
ncbi:MAG TPA: tol-pal system protein YbgF [Accumulibacter sp.]|jgi:tol-pal system protein YbgF|nr:tol-pal system protein YbgF [Accumulibacter sp.]